MELDYSISYPLYAMKNKLPTPQYEYQFVNIIFNVPGLQHSTPVYHPHDMKASVGRILRTYYNKVTIYCLLLGTPQCIYDMVETFEIWVLPGYT